ncbi:hypothetical protein [Streptacidiphilus anmyonensis]|uniref:hypothetical protein n=1 Tax=Streptacidiphilus anmyonensis TaxID=405782 RepID=UPI0005A9EC48|nr:hypothetical protein [Streptacidiphilus anmyonensis]
MSDYELRAEHEPADPVGRQTLRWHIVRERRLVAICGRLIDPVSDSRAIRRVDETAPDSRCEDCWDWWDVVSEARHERLLVAAEQASADGAEEPSRRPGSARAGPQLFREAGHA